MSLFIALALVAVAGTFLLALGVTALVRPPIARRFLLGFAQSASRHYSELAFRFAIGAALIVAAPRMAGTEVVAGAGMVLLATTAVMLFVPWRSHQSFAQRAVPKALAYLPAIGLSSVAAGAATLWALFGADAG
jgi:hypothetical protein